MDRISRPIISSTSDLLGKGKAQSKIKLSWLVEFQCKVEWQWPHVSETSFLTSSSLQYKIMIVWLDFMAEQRLSYARTRQHPKAQDCCRGHAYLGLIQPEKSSQTIMIVVQVASHAWHFLHIRCKGAFNPATRVCVRACVWY